MTSLRTFNRIAGSTIVLSSIYLAWLVRWGRVGIGYQGDEGIRVFDAYQNAFELPNSVHGSVWESAKGTFFGVHPPGDNLVRSLFAWLIDLVGIELGPVTAMFLLSIITVGIAHFVAADLARRAAGVAAGYLTLFALFASYVFSDVKLSSMGEAIAMPLLVSSLLVVQIALTDRPNVDRAIAGGGVLFALSTFVRPEVSLMLPGLCLALWYLVGFARASLYGAIAGSFEIVKLANSFLFATDDELSLLNVGASYFNGTKTIATLWRSDFIQQLLHEPGLVPFVAGFLASFVFLLRPTDRTSIAWRSHLLVIAATISYLLINIASQLLGLSPHSAYRIVIAVSPTIAIGSSIAIVELAKRLLPKVESRLGNERAMALVSVSLAIIGIWSGIYFLTTRVDQLAARVPEGVRISADEIIAYADDDDAIFIDHMRYWENAMLGYFADRDAPVCDYARCIVAEEGAQAYWNARRDDVAQPGTTSFGEFTALRVHTFIHENRPEHIVIASEAIHRDWTRVASGIWGDEAPLWSSHIYPYLDGEVNFDDPQEQVLRIGVINDVQYFEEYVRLVPRDTSDVGIVYEAFYDVEPETNS